MQSFQKDCGIKCQTGQHLKGNVLIFSPWNFCPPYLIQSSGSRDETSINMCTLFTQYMHLFREGNKQKFETWFLPLRTLVAWSP